MVFQISLCDGWRPSCVSANSELRYLLRLGYAPRRYATGYLARTTDLHYTHWWPPTRTAYSQIRRWHHGERNHRERQCLWNAEHDSHIGWVEWSELNRMNINTKKTKEMVMGSCGTKMNTLMISSTTVERVSTYKLLSVVTSSSVPTWNVKITCQQSRLKRQEEYSFWRSWSMQVLQ